MRTLADLQSLDGRVALVVGGHGHVGAAVCDALEELGARVAVADLDDDTRGSMSSAMTTRPGFTVDLGDETSTRQLVPHVLDKFGRLDILVHSAAYVGATIRAGWSAPLPQQTVDAWDEALRVNLTSAFVLIQSAIDPLRESGAGSVVLIGSIYGMVAPDFRLYEGTTMQNPAAYGVSKAGMIQLARHFAIALAPHVRVNVVSPGGISRSQPAAFVDRYVARTPLRRMATEEDLKGTVAWLASDLSRYVTGQNVIVDGGWTIW